MTLISRRNKRLILNEGELLAAAARTGAAVRLAALEELSLYESLALLRRTTVLAGMHGSALINSLFLPAGAALLQLLPYKVEAGAVFFQGTAEARGVRYVEWRNRRRDAAVFHWHFLGADYPPERRQAMLEEGSNCCGEVAFFSFWINQDTRVDSGEWSAALGEALDSPLNRELRGAAAGGGGGDGRDGRADAAGRAAAAEGEAAMA